MVPSEVKVYCPCFPLLYIFNPCLCVVFFLSFSKSWAFVTSVNHCFLWGCWTHENTSIPDLRHVHIKSPFSTAWMFFFFLSGSVCPHLTKYRTRQGLRPAPNPHFDWIYILINIWCLMNGVSGRYFGQALVLWMQGCNYVRALWSRLSLVRLDLLGCIKRRPTTILQ